MGRVLCYIPELDNKAVTRIEEDGPKCANEVENQKPSKPRKARERGLSKSKANECARGERFREQAS